MQFYQNGIVVQRINHENMYKGIEGDNWYLNYLGNSKEFDLYYDNEIEKAWINSEYVDCCSEMSYIEKYVLESKKKNIEFRILLCETTKSKPQIVINKPFKIYFIGYDYAYAGGSYYSCVNNDIVSDRIPELKEIRLNKNGLFNEVDEIQKFIKQRELLKKKYPRGTFETGEFIIYKISEIRCLI